MTLSVLNKRSSKSKMVMSLVSPFVLVCMQYNILFRAVYIPTKLNIADSISRKQWDRFRQVAPRADHFPLPIPSAFTNLISSLYLMQKFQITHTGLALQVSTLIMNFARNNNLCKTGHQTCLQSYNLSCIYP